VGGAHNGLSARLVEEAGFDAVWASGFEMSASYGLPDADLLSMAELLQGARGINAAVTIPVIADCDTGYGNAVNVIRTVQEYEAAGIAQSVLHDVAGGAHPLTHGVEEAVKSGDWRKLLGAIKSVIAVYDDKGLPSPRLRIAAEIEGDLLDIAEAQSRLAESVTDSPQKQVGLATAAFLAGAALEDALRRICDAKGVKYDVQRSSVAKLQAALYQPSNQVEFITQSENKQLTVWGDTRNKADHGKFGDITQTEVLAMIIGVRAFVNKHLP
jgi:hypothetical protein